MLLHVGPAVQSGRYGLNPVTASNALRKKNGGVCHAFTVPGPALHPDPVSVILSLMPGDSRVSALFAAGTASAAEAPDCRIEFDNIFNRAAGAPSLTVEEVALLLSRCEALKPPIEKLNEPERTIFLERLKMCQELFLYVLESKEGGT